MHKNKTNNSCKGAFHLLFAKFIILSLFFSLNPHTGYSQGSCLNAKTLSSNDSIIYIVSQDSVVWFKYHATSPFFSLDLFLTDTVPVTINGIDFYSGTCTNLSLINTSSNPWINIENLPVGDDYYLKIRKPITTQSITFRLSTKQLILNCVSQICADPVSLGCDLVCNGNFEYYTSVPNGISQIGLACPWGSVNGANPDYYHADASGPGSSYCDVPSNSQGYQFSSGLPSDGGYAGFMAYNANSPSSYLIYSEYIYQKLKAPLLQGITYTVTLSVSLADKCTHAVSNIGIFLCHYDPYIPGVPGTNTGPINYIPNQTFLFQNPVSDKVNWQTLTFNYTPSINGIEYIVIGAFGTPNAVPLYSGSILSSYYYVDEVHITPVIPNLTINANPNPVCNGSSTTLTNNLNVPISWSANPSCYLSCPNNCPSTAAIPISNTTFTGTLTLAPNCIVTATKNVAVSPISTPTLNGPTTACPGQTVVYTTDPGMSNYHWQVTGGTIQGASNTHTITVIWQSSGSVSISYTNSSGCPSANPTLINVTVTPIPSPIISGPTINCEFKADYIIENPQSHATYSWSVIAGGILAGSSHDQASVEWDVPIDNYNPGILTVTVNIDGCESSASVNVYDCCYKEGSRLIHDETITSSTPPLSPGETVFINGTVHIATDWDLHNNTLQMGPFARIIVDPSFTLIIDDQSVIESYCRFMWDGIYAKDPSSRIILSNSTLRDAINGIVSISNGQINVSQNTFEDNYTCITIKDYVPTNPHPILHSAYIAQNQFLGSSQTLKEPYSNTYPYTGIDINKVMYVTIGDETDISFTNTFDGLYCGIHANTAHMTVYNNIFRNFNSTTISSGIDPTQIYRPTAIFSANPKELDSKIDWPVSIIGGGAYRQNVIENSDMGIYTYNQKVTILKNKIEAYTTAVECREVWDYSEIMNNSINSSNNIFPKTGMRIYNYYPTLVNLKVAENEVYALLRGIYISQCQSLINPIANFLTSVEQNTIKIPDNVGSPIKYVAALDIQNCEGIFASKNIMERFQYFVPTSFLPIYGINLVQTRSGLLKDNTYINGYEAGINIFGNCNLTQFYCNSMNDCYYGFLFNTDASITQQGSSSYSTNNRWVGDYLYQTAPDIYRKMWGFNHLITQTTFWHISSTAPGGYFDPMIDFYHPLYLNIIPFINPPDAQGCPMKQVLSASTSGEREEMYGTILRGEINYDTLETQYSHYDKSSLFKALDADSTLLSMGDTADIHYRAFYDTVKCSNTGKIHQMELMLKDNKVSEALALNNSLLNTDLVEEYYKIVNDIYLETFARGYYVLAPDQAEVLGYIAEHTPWEGGDAVYIARYMLNMDPDDIRAVYLKHPKANLETEQSVRLYPNPAKDEVTLAFEKIPEGRFTFKVYDITGREIINQKITSKTLLIKLRLNNLYKGIYVYKIESDTMSPLSGKLIIE